jgi:hypothetical protein
MGIIKPVSFPPGSRYYFPEIRSACQSFNFSALGVAGVRQERNVASLLNCFAELTLMGSAGADNAPGNNFSALGNEIAQSFYFFVINHKVRV